MHAATAISGSTLATTPNVLQMASTTAQLAKDKVAHNTVHFVQMLILTVVSRVMLLSKLLITQLRSAYTLKPFSRNQTTPLSLLIALRRISN